MTSSFTLGRIGGIEIGIHYTWLFAFALISWSLASGFFPITYPGWDQSTYWLLGGLSALGLFLSVLVHELSHSFVALARGLKVHSITLFIFGGVSNIKDEADEPQDEFLIAVVGPLTSLALAGLFWAALVTLDPGSSPLGAALTYLAVVNGLLGLFNLLPGFPLDGGRVLRAAVWGATGSLRRATNVASYVGQGIAFLMILYGVWQLLSGDFLGGLWIAFIGWFLNNAAEATRQAQAIKESLHGVRVGELMTPIVATAHPLMPVEAFVMDHVVRQGQRALPVVNEGRLVGIVSITDAKEVPRDDWSTTPVAEVMTRAPLKTISPGAELNDALKLLVDGSFHQLPVVDRGRLVGMLNRADILRFLQLREELGLPRSARSSAERDALREPVAGLRR